MEHFLKLKKMYSDSSFLNVFGFWSLKIKWIPESGEVIVSQLVSLPLMRLKMTVGLSQACVSNGASHVVCY